MCVALWYTQPHNRNYRIKEERYSRAHVRGDLDITDTCQDCSIVASSPLRSDFAQHLMIKWRLKTTLLARTSEFSGVSYLKKHVCDIQTAKHCGNSIANALDLPQPGTMPSIPYLWPTAVNIAMVTRRTVTYFIVVLCRDKSVRQNVRRVR